MDEEILSVFSDKDRELYLGLDTLDILTHMNAAFSYLTRMQSNMAYMVARERRIGARQTEGWSKIFHAVSRRQATVELELYPVSYATLAQEIIELNNRVVDSEPGTDYTVFVPELEEKMNAINLHMNFITNRLNIVRGTETKRKFTLN
ncbi:MAG: hypothetical protein JWO78_659 [Micavibrio sp.]|nr:hypothetical protein [Micavibrio sp.]